MTDKKKKSSTKKQKGTVNQMGKQNQSVIVKVNVGNSGGGKKRKKAGGGGGNQTKKQPDTAQILAQALARSNAMNAQAERIREFNRPPPAFTTEPSVRSNPLPARPRSPPPMAERYNRQPAQASSPIIEEVVDEPVNQGGFLLEDEPVNNQGGGLLEDGPADQGGYLLENGGEEEEEEEATPPVMYENPMHRQKEKAPTPLVERLRLNQPSMVKNIPRGGPLNRDWSPVSMSERLQQSRQNPAPVSGEKATTDEPESPMRDMMPGDKSPPPRQTSAPPEQSSSRPAIERGRPASQEKINLRIRMMKDINALPDDKVVEHIKQRGIQAELGTQELLTIYERVKGEPYPYQNNSRNTILSALGALHVPKSRKKKDDDEE